MKKLKYILTIIVLLFAQEWVKASDNKEEAFRPQEVIFEHLGDEYGWKIWNLEIPLPVIIADQGKLYLFSSLRLKDGAAYNGCHIAADGEYAGKIVCLDANGEEYRPWDISITKNVLALMICALTMCWAIFPLVRWYRKNRYAAPRKVPGMMEVMVGMLYKELIVEILGKDARRFAPYLLTLFFFILFSNLLGMIVVFPGGANIMGNMAVTLVLAVCTFVVVNVSGTRHYWREIFWPEVPTWLKFPIPMMPLIEIFGVFTKPIALMVRLFANMLGGHLITLVLISLIFLFGAMGAVVTGATTVVAVTFSVFMNLIDLLICFIQAYVFMMLSTIFISLARPKENEVAE